MSKEQERRQDGVIPVPIWAPQCNSCLDNLDGNNCAAWETSIPVGYYWGEERCPRYSHRKGMEWPPVQRTPEMDTDT